MCELIRETYSVRACSDPGGYFMSSLLSPFPFLFSCSLCRRPPQWTYSGPLVDLSGLRRKEYEKGKRKEERELNGHMDRNKQPPLKVNRAACGARNVRKGRREERGNKMAASVDLSEEMDQTQWT